MTRDLLLDAKSGADLADLAADIRREHAAGAGKAAEALAHARRAGELLAEAKARLPHGAWLPWLAEHAAVTPRQAQRYMRLAEHWEQIAAKCELSSHLGINDALRLLDAPDDVQAEALDLLAAAQADAQAFAQADASAVVRADVLDLKADLLSRALARTQTDVQARARAFARLSVQAETPANALGLLACELAAAKADLLAFAQADAPAEAPADVRAEALDLLARGLARGLADLLASASASAELRNQPPSAGAAQATKENRT